MTERRAAHLALAETEQRVRLVVKNFAVYKIFRLVPSGVIVNWNAGAQRIKGYHEREIVGRHFSQFYTWEDRVAGLPAKVLETARSEGRYESEGWRVRKDGTRFWAAVVIDAIRGDDGQLLGFAKITRDITERRAAQEALRASERQFRLLMNSVTDYAMFMLDLNGVVISWNAEAERIKGYRAEEIIGQHFSKFYTEADRLAGVPTQSLNIAAAEGRFEAEGQRVRKDGGLFWANVVIDPVRDENGTIIGYAKITRDITERRQAQQALEQAQVQLAHAQKMEALGQLTGGVAHDFNNLLMVISGYIHTLKGRLAGDPKLARAANAIEAAAQRGEALTRQLLSFSRRQSLHPVVLNLNEVLDALQPMLKTSLGQMRVKVAFGPNVWRVRLDRNEFELAMINLMLNARDAMGQEGIVTLSAENVVVKRGDIPGDAEGEFVALSLTDNGVGIPPEILPKVFDPFFTTKGIGKGTGLGLSQVHGFVFQSGGSINIISKPGQGTRVTLYLPRAKAETLVEVATSGDLAGPMQQPGRVLLVEDNKEVADATREMLESIGATVQIASSAAAALDKLGAAEFDFVLSDIVMEGMNGLELARTIRKRHPDLPVLLATGYSTAAEDAAAEFVVLRKPYQAEALSAAIAALKSGERGGRTGATVVPFNRSSRFR
jgi:PAS domain S-box-containing protein